MAVRSFDLMQFMGSVSAEHEADVGSLVSGAPRGNGLGQQLRSLAHPEWPYTGTAHEWRGFAGKVEARFQYLNFGPDLP